MEARYGVGNGSKNRAASVSDSGKNESATEPTTWAPVDLTDAIAGKDVEAPVLWERWDGERFIYGSRVHWFQGEPESCKSLAAQAIAAERLRAGEHVLYIDFEDDDRGVVGKLKALGVLDEQIASHFAYVRPDEPLDAASLEAVLDAHPYTLAVIDGVTEAMTVQGLELNSNADVASWIRMLPKRIASRGPATICIDHVTKASETRGRFAIGAQHKLAGTTGASYAFTKVKDFHRAFGSEPVEGLVEITVVKDRPGYVRGHVLDGKVGDLVLSRVNHVDVFHATWRGRPS